MRARRGAVLCSMMVMIWGGVSVAQSAGSAPVRRLRLESPAFADCSVIPDKFTAAVASPVSPALGWRDAPAGTVSFVLIMHDPDEAPKRSAEDFLHWIVFNIPGSVHALRENIPHAAELPDGAVQVVNRKGYPGYMGPGARFVYHHYTFELYALDTKLPLGSRATRDQILAAMNGHVIAKAAYVGRFHR